MTPSQLRRLLPSLRSHQEISTSSMPRHAKSFAASLRAKKKIPTDMVSHAKGTATTLGPNKRQLVHIGRCNVCSRELYDYKHGPSTLEQPERKVKEYAIGAGLGISTILAYNWLKSRWWPDSQANEASEKFKK